MRRQSTSAWTYPRTAFKRLPDAWCRRSASNSFRRGPKRVIRQLDRVRKQRAKDIRDLRNYDRGVEWSPTAEDVDRNWRARGAEEHTLIWAAHQLKRWSRRLAIERGEDPPERDDVLANVRNALEHLDESDLDVGHAVPGPLGSNRSLRLLPDGRLRVQVGADLGGGLIAPEELEKRALGVVQRLEDELNTEVQHLYGAAGATDEWRMSNDAPRRRLFPDEFDDTFPVGAEQATSHSLAAMSCKDLSTGSTTSFTVPSSDGIATVRLARRATGLGFVDRRSRTDSPDW